ncbi:hypothetical protein HUZ36_04400 [Pseudoalteromonas sp. McH1-7]|uniref:hypothetical protein n=1 Tax=Pseudoalteromonas sp. McH1-7 TaxID=2745574 RepID=UPI0015914FA9|nr:hypothetical protein [Pseudoalteromonas sp. McH1-7]NUZ10013.1 hypothetical protein [Pseudoalteromonas sp. McH1-7]
MFYVYGVSRKKCRAKAEKDVAARFGDKAPKTQSEHIAAVEARTTELYSKAKPVCVSGELSTPSSLYQFIELAKKTDELKDLMPMRRKPMIDASGNPIKTRAGRPRYEFVPVDSNYIREMAQPCSLI